MPPREPRDRRFEPSFPPRGYPDPGEIPQIRAAIQAGGEYRIPHQSSVLGFRLAEWGSVFTADTASPGGADYAQGAGGSAGSGGAGSVEGTTQVEWGPLYLSGSKGLRGEIRYEVGLRLAARQVQGPNGVQVTFHRSLSVSGSGHGWLNRVLEFRVNYLDYRAGAPTDRLPANGASAGWYFRVAPWRAAVAAATAAVLVASAYALWQIVSTSPIPERSFLRP